MKTDAYHGGASKRVPFMMSLLFLFLFVTSSEKGSARHARTTRVAEIADEAEETLSIFKRAMAAAVLIGGSLFTIHCVAL